MKKTLITLAALAMTSVAFADFTTKPTIVDSNGYQLADIGSYAMTFYIPEDTTLSSAVTLATINFGGTTSPNGYTFTLSQSGSTYSLTAGRNTNDSVTFTGLTAGTTYTLSGADATSANHTHNITLNGETKGFEGQIYVSGPQATATTYFNTAYSVPTSGGSDNVPEPTTATLSLLALAGLAARRRRK